MCVCVGGGRGAETRRRGSHGSQEEKADTAMRTHVKHLHVCNGTSRCVYVRVCGGGGG